MAVMYGKNCSNMVNMIENMSMADEECSAWLLMRSQRSSCPSEPFTRVR